MKIKISTPDFDRTYNSVTELISDEEVNRSDRATETFGTATVVYDDGRTVEFTQDEDGWYACDERETPLNRYLSDLI